MKWRDLAHDWRAWAYLAMILSYITAGIVAYANRPPPYDPEMVETLIKLHELTGDL